MVAILVVLAVAALGMALNVSQRHLAAAVLHELTRQVVTSLDAELARIPYDRHAG